MPFGDTNALDYLLGSAPPPALGPNPFGPPKTAPGDDDPAEIARAVWQHSGRGQQQPVAQADLNGVMDVYNKAGLQHPNAASIEERLAADPSNWPPFEKPPVAKQSPSQQAEPQPAAEAKQAKPKSDFMFIQNGSQTPEIIEYLNGRAANSSQSQELYPTKADPALVERLRAAGAGEDFIQNYHAGVAANQVRAQVAAEKRRELYGFDPQQAGAGQAAPGMAARPTLDWYLRQVPQVGGLPNFDMMLGALDAYNRQEQLRLLEQNNLARNLNDREKNDLLRRQIDEKYDPRSIRMRHTLEALEKNPNATPAQVLGQVDRIMETIQAMEDRTSKPAAEASPAGRLGSDATGIEAMRPNTISLERQRRDRLGPEIYGLLNQPTKPGEGNAHVEKLLTQIYNTDKRSPGYMQNNGPEIIDLIKNNYGESALNNFMNPGAFQNALEGAGGLFSDYSDLAKARAAMRHYMGYGKPLPIGIRYNPLLRMNPTVSSLFDRMASPHRGIAPIPGSPAAGR